MKRILPMSIVVLLLTAATVSAQDIIVKRDAEEIEAKVLEVDGSRIVYKKFSNPEGPNYTVAKDEVFMIKYQNGEKDVFRQEPTAETRSNETDQAPKRANVLPPLPEGLGKNPWAGKFKAGIRAEGGFELMTILAEGYTDQSFGYYFGGTAYGEYHTKSRAGWMFGLGAGYRQSVFTEKVEEIKAITNVGAVKLDLYAGMMTAGYKYDRVTQSYSARKTALASRYGLRFKMPVSATSRVTGMERQDMTGNLNPVQAGVFSDLVYHIKGFGIGMDVSLMFGNLYKMQGMNVVTMTISMGLLCEYTF